MEDVKCNPEGNFITQLFYSLRVFIYRVDGFMSVSKHLKFHRKNKNRHKLGNRAEEFGVASWLGGQYT